jgi:hypothetical protein
LAATVYAFDSTTIDLCLALFPWATFLKRKGAVKLHTLLDLRGNIPSVCFLTPGGVHDVNLSDQLLIEAGAFYIRDCGYLDFARLARLHQALGFFVTRAKRNFPNLRLSSGVGSIVHLAAACRMTVCGSADCGPCSGQDSSPGCTRIR